MHRVDDWNGMKIKVFVPLSATFNQRIRCPVDDEDIEKYYASIGWTRPPIKYDQDYYDLNKDNHKGAPIDQENIDSCEKAQALSTITQCVCCCGLFIWLIVFIVGLDYT